MKKLFSFFLLLTLTTPVYPQPAPPTDKGLDDFLEGLIKEIEAEEAKKKKPAPQKPVALEEEEKKEEEVEATKDMRTLFLESLKPEQKKLSKAKKEALFHFMQELTTTLGKISQKISSLDAYNRGKFTSYVPLLNDVEILLGELLAEEEHLKSLATAENEPFRQQILNLLLPELQNLNREIEVESERPSLGPIVLALASHTLLAQNGPVNIATTTEEKGFFKKYVQDPSSKVLDALTSTWEYLKSWFVTTEEKPAPKPKKVVAPEPPEEEVSPVERSVITQPEIIRKRELSERERKLEELVQIKYSTLTKMALRKLREFFDMSLMSLKATLEKVVKSSAKAIEEKKQERKAEIKKAEEQRALLEKQAGTQRPPAYTPPKWPEASPYPTTPYSPRWPGYSPGGRSWWRKPGARPTARTTKPTSKTTKPSKTKTAKAGEEEKEEEKIGGAVGKDNPITKEQKLKETIVDRVAEVKKLIEAGDTITAQNTVREIDRHQQELSRIVDKLKTLSAYQAKKREKKWQEKNQEYQDALKELEGYRKKVGTPKAGEESKLQAKLRIEELKDKSEDTAKGLLEDDAKIAALKLVQGALSAYLTPAAGSTLETLLNNIGALNNHAHYTGTPGLSALEAKGAVFAQLDKVKILVRDLTDRGWEHLRSMATAPVTPAEQKEAIKKLQELKAMKDELTTLAP